MDIRTGVAGGAKIPNEHGLRLMALESVWIEDLTWVEAEEALKGYEVVMIPLGARTKEHGPHLPLNNDWIMAEYLARRVAAEVPVAVMPTLQYGYYPSFLEYPGSVSLGLETFKEAVKDVCVSMNGYGISKFYVLNTGVSTIRGLQPAAEELRERGIEMRFTDILASGARAEEGVSEQEGGTHADEMETSMMLYIRPGVVDMSKAVKDYDPVGGRGLTRDPENTEAKYSPTGVFGDPTLATVEKGRVAVEARVRYIVEELRAFIEE
jgi:creatinine amidohydrolase